MARPGQSACREAEDEGGELRGELVVRGQPHRFAVPLRSTAQWDIVVAAGTWEGKLTDLGIKPFAALFGAPNDWRLEAGGKLTKDWETPEYREATGYVRDLFASGVYHPNSTTFASGVVARAQLFRQWR